MICPSSWSLSKVCGSREGRIETRSPQWILNAFFAWRPDIPERASANVKGVSPFFGLWPFWLNTREQCVPGIASVSGCCGGELETTRELEHERERETERGGRRERNSRLQKWRLRGKMTNIMKTQASSSAFKWTVRNYHAASVFFTSSKSNATQNSWRERDLLKIIAATPSYFDASTGLTASSQQHCGWNLKGAFDIPPNSLAI